MHAVSRPVACCLMLIATLATLASRTSAANTTHCDKRVFLDSCLKQLPPMLTEAQITGLPKSKQEVDALCGAFKTGMKCIDEYSTMCLSNRERHIVEAHITGARDTFRFLCDDKKFQAEYLQYTSCYRGMSKDWDSCADRFMSLVREELSRKNTSEHTKLIGLCCAKFGFLRCVFVSSRYKCTQEAAVFLHRIADTLANVRVYSPQCQGVDEKVCSSCGTLVPLLSLLVVSLMQLLSHC